MLIDPTDPGQPNGSIHGFTRRVYRGSTVLYARSARTNPATPRQRSNRGTFRSIVGVWNDDVSSGQKSDWSSWAGNSVWETDTGKTTFLDAYPAFAAVNMRRVRAGLSPRLAAPATFGQADDGLFSSTVDPVTGDIEISFDVADAWLDDDGALIVTAFTPTGDGRITRGPQAAHVGCILGNTSTPPTSPVTFSNPFIIPPNPCQTVKVASINAAGKPGVTTVIPCPPPPPPSGPVCPCPSPPLVEGTIFIDVLLKRCGFGTNDATYIDDTTVTGTCNWVFQIQPTVKFADVELVCVNPPFWKCTGRTGNEFFEFRNFTSPGGLGDYDPVSPVCAGPFTREAFSCKLFQV